MTEVPSNLIAGAMLLTLLFVFVVVALRSFRLSLILLS